MFEEWLARKSNSWPVHHEPQSKAAQAHATGPEPAGPVKLDPKCDNTLEEWLMFVTFMRLKRKSVVEELPHLGESLTTEMAKRNLDYLEFIPDLVEDVLRKGVCAIYNLDTAPDFSDFLAYLREFRKVFNETIDDIEQLVRAADAVITSCPIGRMLEAEATAT